MDTGWETQANIDLTNRQTVINEWTFNDKMETLFIFQLMFFGLLVLCLLMILSKYGFFAKSFVWLIAAIMAIAIGTTWFFRAAYTKNVRDKKYWNKRYFAGDFSTAPAVPPGEVAAAARQILGVCQASAAVAGTTGGCV